MVEHPLIWSAHSKQAYKGRINEVVYHNERISSHNEELAGGRWGTGDNCRSFPYAGRGCGTFIFLAIGRKASAHPKKCPTATQSPLPSHAQNG